MTQKKLWKGALYVLSAAVLVWAIGTDRAAYAAQQKNIENRTAMPLAVGAAAPEFQLTRLSDEAEVSSADLLQQENVYLAVTSPNCPVTEDLMQSFTAAFSEKKGTLAKLNLIIDTGDAPLDSQETKRLREKYPDVVLYSDKDSSVAWGFHISAYPTQYVLAPSGEIVYRQIGFQNENKAEIVAVAQQFFE